MIRSPKAYLMDEPLSNLDAKLRVQMRAEIAELQARLGVTTVYVTHDQSEAMTLGHRVAVLRDGRLQQCAPPQELYDRPANAFVAGFIGSPAMSLLEVPLGGNGSVDVAGVPVPLSRRGLGGRRRARSRPGRRGAAPRGAPPRGDGIAARVEAVEVLGADAYVFCTAEVGRVAETRLADARRVERRAGPRRQRPSRPARRGASLRPRQRRAARARDA